MIVLLWTDALLWVLVALVAGYFWLVHRREHLAAPWRRVAQSPAGMMALVVLGAYVLVGLADSLHFRPRLEPGGKDNGRAYSVEVLSVLDVALAPLRTRTETTYSEPLATRAYARETVDLGGGRVTREFPRLRFGGALLAREQDRGRDIAARVLRGIGVGVVIWLALAAALVGVFAARSTGGPGTLPRWHDRWRAVWGGQTRVAWRGFLAAGAALSVLVCVVASLAQGYHVLGTDKVGLDVLYLALKSVRTGLMIGALTTLVMLPFAVLLGIMAGYFRGWVDDIIQYLYTTLNSIPGVLLIAAAVLMMQVQIDTHPDLFPTSAQRADLRLLFLCVILGLTNWTGLARLLRGETLKLRELEFIQAAQAFGVGHGRIITRHVLPNVMHLVIIALVMDFSGLVLAEAVLSYVGVGVDPSMISFGTMINAARLEIAREPLVWWVLAAAFVFMFVLVLAANLFADAVRDAFDPRVRVGGFTETAPA
jgi:peptide/nickel transport system permease protein